MARLSEDDRSARWWVWSWLAGTILIVMVAAGCGRLAGLYWFPWEIRMQTGMIRASNSYVTTQQAALRQMRAGWDDAASDGQRAGLVRQMHEIADMIPDDVQPDIRAFLSSH